MDQRDEIKARLSIVDLVSEYVELKKAGRNFKGLCPFHSEKSPSFVVSPDKEICHCFGCHKGGDIFSFYQEVEGVEFIQALKDLGSKVGVQIQEVSQESVKINKGKKDNLYELHKIATDHFVSNLHNTDEGKKVLDYLNKRGVSSDMIEKYKIGFALDSYDDLYKIFLSKGFNKPEIVESGLATSKDTEYSKIFDRFRLRLIFPIFSKDGKVIGFGGRALKADEPAKYLNSPETPIYHKSDVLYGFNFAKEEIRKSDQVILVEGYFDQIAMTQAGIKNVVSVSGTALTPRHLHLLGKFCKNILFCLDSDSAGIEALYRSSELALEEGFNLKVLKLGEYKDPGELLQKDPEKLHQIVNDGVDLFDRILEIEYLPFSFEERSDLNFLSNFLAKILPLVRKISSPILQDVVVRKIASAINVSVEMIYDEMKKTSKHRHKKDIKSEVDAYSKKISYSLEEHFWGYLFWYPEAFSSIAENVLKMDFLFKEKAIYKIFVDYYNNGRDLRELLITECVLDNSLKEKYAIVVVYLESVASEEWSCEMVQAELERLMTRIRLEYRKVELSKLEAEIREAERLKDGKRLKELLGTHQKVISL
jgi:DNA primase